MREGGWHGCFANYSDFNHILELFCNYANDIQSENGNNKCPKCKDVTKM
jgi:hypothetical protein